MFRTSSARAVVIAAVCLFAGSASAELYKWVDEQGNVHFSDRAPRDRGAVNLHEEDRAPGTSRSSATAARPYTGAAPSRLAYLREVMVHFEDVPPGRSKVIGEMSSGASCTGPQPIKIKSGFKLAREASMRWHFHQALEELGYRSPRAIKTSFDAEEEETADLSIIAVITELEVSECVMRGGSKRSPYQSGRTRERVKNRSKITVDWQVRDNLARRVVHESTTEGDVDDGRFVERSDDMPGTLERAFLAAARGLLADASFTELLSPEHEDVARVSHRNRAAGRTSPVDVVEGRCNGRGASFQARFDGLRAATATIRTATGHGSGFLLSADGFVLTNAHVVGSSRNVLVILDGESYDASVVSTDPVRDVALVELEELPPAEPLAVCRARAPVGNTVYVVGTPLDERLSLTVTRGIISQHRTMKDQPYYQTDAVINRGNSGGPAFNDQGEVIAIAVAGLFTKGGAGMGINYLIPIDEALAAVVGAGPASAGD